MDDGGRKEGDRGRGTVKSGGNGVGRGVGGWGGGGGDFLSFNVTEQ